MPLPAAYVLPLGQDADGNQIWNGLIQIIHKTIGVAVELDAQTDRRGQAPTMAFEEIETQIFASCLNLTIDECRMVRGASFSARGISTSTARASVSMGIRTRLADYRRGWRSAGIGSARTDRGRYLQSARRCRRYARRRCRYTDRRAAASARDRWTVAGARLFPERLLAGGLQMRWLAALVLALLRARARRAIARHRGAAVRAVAHRAAGKHRGQPRAGREAGLSAGRRQCRGRRAGPMGPPRSRPH